MIREMELLFQASRTSPMLHEAAVTVEEGIAALRAERDELVLQNERLGNDIVAAEAALADTRRALADGARIAAQYLDTGRGDLDGWADRARALAAAVRDAKGETT